MNEAENDDLTICPMCESELTEGETSILYCDFCGTECCDNCLDPHQDTCDEAP